MSGKGCRVSPQEKESYLSLKIPGMIPRRGNRATGANCRRALTSSGIPGIVYPWGDSVHKYFVHRDKREGKAHQEAAGV